MKKLPLAHPFLAFFPLPECSKAPFRRILGTLMLLANSDEPDVWMLQDDALLEEFCVVRASSVRAFSSLRNDLVVLCSAVRNSTHPELNPGLHTVEKVRFYMQLLSDSGSQASPRKVSDTLTQQLDAGEARFVEHLRHLEALFEDTPGLVPIYRNLRSTDWLAVVEFLAATTGRLLGARMVTT